MTFGKVVSNVVPKICMQGYSLAISLSLLPYFFFLSLETGAHLTDGHALDMILNIMGGLYLHVYLLVFERSLTKDGEELEAILFKHYSTEVSEILGSKLETRDFPLFPPELSI